MEANGLARLKDEGQGGQPVVGDPLEFSISKRRSAVDRTGGQLTSIHGPGGFDETGGTHLPTLRSCHVCGRLDETTEA